MMHATDDQAARIYAGLTCGQWAEIEAHAAPSTVARARGQATRVETATVLVREAMRVGVLTGDHQEG